MALLAIMSCQSESNSSESDDTSDSHSFESTRQPKSDETEEKASATACAALLHLSKQCGAAVSKCVPVFLHRLPGKYELSTFVVSSIV